MANCMDHALSHLILGSFGFLCAVLIILNTSSLRKAEVKRMAFYATMLDQFEAWEKFREYEWTIKSKRIGP